MRNNREAERKRNKIIEIIQREMREEKGIEVERRVVIRSKKVSY